MRVGGLGSVEGGWEASPGSQTLTPGPSEPRNYLLTDMALSPREAQGKLPRGAGIPGGAEVEEQRSGRLGGRAPLLIGTWKKDSLQQCADLWGALRA